MFVSSENHAHSGLDDAGQDPALLRDRAPSLGALAGAVNNRQSAFTGAWNPLHTTNDAEFHDPGDEAH